MRLFTIAKGTDIRVIAPKASWFHDEQEGNDKVSTKDMSFELEDMIIDPTGIHPIAHGPQNKVTIGSWYASQGFYGFNFKDHSVIVASSKVVVN